MYVLSSVFLSVSKGHFHFLIWIMQAWLHGEGVTLPVPMEYDTTLAQQSNALAERWDEARNETDPSALFDPSDLQGLDANQIGECPSYHWSQYISTIRQWSSWSIFNPSLHFPKHTSILSETYTAYPTRLMLKFVSGFTKLPFWTQFQLQLLYMPSVQPHG